MMAGITSRDNPKVKQARSLRQRKHREASGMFLVEGIHHVGEAVQSAATGTNGTSIEHIFYAPDLLTSEFAIQLIQDQIQAGTPCFSASEDIFRSLTEKENPQGILAVVRQVEARLGELNPTNFPWGVALMTPQDPGNIGTILRTIDGVGAAGLILIDNSADPYHPSAVRASMGAIFWRPVARTSLEEFREWTGQYSFNIYGTSARGSRDYRTEASYHLPLVLLMGSEREGLSAEALKICSELVRLPMQGRVSSLNLAVAAGVMLYEIHAQVKNLGG